MDKIELQIEIKLEDLLDYYRYQFDKNYVQKIARWLGIISGIILILLGLLLPEQRYLCLVGALIMFIIVFIPGFRIKLLAKKILNSEKVYASKIRYELDEFGIKTDAHLANGFCKWERITSIVVRNNILLFHVNDISAVIIPRRYLDQNQIEVLKKIIKLKNIPLKY